MFLHITKVKYIVDYTIEVFFNDGRNGVVDLSEVLKGSIFEIVKEPTVFAQLKLDKELGTIIWPNGADLAPEYIYFHTFKNVPELQEQFEKWGYTNNPN